MDNSVNILRWIDQLPFSIHENRSIFAAKQKATTYVRSIDKIPYFCEMSYVVDQRGQTQTHTYTFNFIY